MRKVGQSVALLAFISGISPAFGADTVYKVVGPDGSIVYSDVPPAAAAKSHTLEFRNQPSSPLPPSALRFRADMEKRIQTRNAAQRAPRPGEMQLFTAAWCPYCKRAKAHLKRRDVAFTEFDIDTPDGMEAFVRASGRAVPLLLTGGARTEGYSESIYNRVVAARQKP